MTPSTSLKILRHVTTILDKKKPAQNRKDKESCGVLARIRNIYIYVLEELKNAQDYREEVAQVSSRKS